MIPYGRQSISEEDISAVVGILRSEWITQGPTIEVFEKAVASRCRAGYGVAASNGTASLHLACMALGVGRGDMLWTSPNSFVASANCGLYCGASVDFVDIDPNTYNMCATALENKLRQARRAGARLPKVVVPVHFSGQPCDMARIGELAREFGFRVIEDASHALGATYHGEPIGNCRHSDIAVFSFHPVKMITTGEGGMAMTNDRKLAELMRRLRSHGITRNPEEMDAACEGGWYYQQIDLGYNYRLTDIQSALGLSQLHRLDAFIERRQQLAARYRAGLTDCPVRLPAVREDRESSWHLYVVQLEGEFGQAQTRKTVFNRLRSLGIGVNVHYIPIHLQPHFRRLGFKRGDFPHAEAYYENAITLPLFPDMTSDDSDTVIAALKSVLEQGKT